MAFTAPGALALDGGDPRISMGDGQIQQPVVVHRRLHDPNIPYEEYRYYANIQREQERKGLGPAERTALQLAGLTNHSGKASSDVNGPEDSAGDEKKAAISNEKRQLEREAGGLNTPIIAPAEWENASRAARNATWGAVFYLITTDILGPYAAPYAVSKFGYVGGILMYTIMGLMAFFAGWQIWRMFLKLDSDRYPMRTFGDLGFRIFGTWTRHGMNILQSIQLFFNVGIIIIGNGQGLSQMAKFKLCFSVCTLVWALAGMILGQIRTLQKFGHLANFAIWLNVLVIFMTMGEAAHSPPNYQAATAQPGVVKGPITHTVWVPPGISWIDQLNAAMQIVYAYGGAMLYCEFMAEMKRPWDFIKAQLCAEIFIFVCYLIFGLVVYSQQGQFVINPANQGLSTYSWQTATNAISLVAALIAGVLYGNIGIKVIYQNVLQELLGAPDLTSKSGRYLWFALVPLYWSCAYIIASAVPQFTNISSLVAAVCILQFTYTFPTFLYFGMQVQEHARHPDEIFDPLTHKVNRVDTWRDASRWKRAFGKQWWMKVFCLLFGVAAATCAVLGAYAAVKSIVVDFKAGHATDFSCRSPVQ